MVYVSVLVDNSVDRTVVGQFDDPASDGGFLNCAERNMAGGWDGTKARGKFTASGGRYAPWLYVGTESSAPPKNLSQS